MDRIFLDANVLFSAAYQMDSGLLAFWKLRNATLYSSRYAIEEAKINLEERTQRHRFAQRTPALQVFDARERELPPGIALPEKDAPILLAAIGGQATHLITGDVRHFGRYFGQTVQGVLIVTPADYLNRREKNGNE
jgi:predicted nucleic acid-binding protein